MRGRRGWLVLALLVVLLLGPVVGLSLYLDVGGVTAPGAVVEKRESIAVSARQTGGWTRRTELVVRYQAADRRAPDTTSFPVDTAFFDRLVIGAPLAVRYPPNRYLRDLLLFPTARPTGQSTLTWLRAIPPPWAARGAPLALIGVVVLLIWLALRERVRGLGWLLAAYVLGATLYLAVPTPDLGGGGGATATAAVRAVHPVSYAYRPRNNSTRRAVRLLQPYELVELRFVPAGQAGPVIAVAAVDAASVSGLAAGREVAITYAAGDPRGASIVGGRRTYAWKNALGLAAAGLVLAALGVVGAILSSAVRRRARAQATAFRAAVEEGRRRREW